MKLSKFMNPKQKVKKEKLEDLPSIPKEFACNSRNSFNDNDTKQ